MILLPHSVRIYVATEPVSLRKSFEGLSNEVRSVLAKDPLSGHLFLFLNKTRARRCKSFCGRAVGSRSCTKCLERGRFTFPDRVVAGASSVEIDAHELSMLLEGLALATTRSAARWSPAASAAA